MARERSPNRDKAKQLWLDSGGTRELKDIAAELLVSDGQVRKWKSVDNWAAESNSNVTNEPPESNGNVANGNTKSNGNVANGNTKSNGNISNVTIHEKERKAKGKKVSTTERNDKQPTQCSNTTDQTQESKTDTPSPFARFGNKNALGNKGGHGGPKGNKYAVRTGEFETFYYSDIDEEERRLLEQEEYFNNKYSQQIILIKDLTLREYKIRKRIKQVEDTPGGMVIESITKAKGTTTTTFGGSDEEDDDGEASKVVRIQDSSSHVAKPVLEKVLRLEEAMSRVQARKQQAIAGLHRMEIDDERLTIDVGKLEIYRQRMSGRVDLDTLFDDEDLLSGLE